MFADQPPDPDEAFSPSSQPTKPHRRSRYAGSHPRRFADRYKELHPARFPGVQEHVRAQGRTPAGTHVPILVDAVLEALAPQQGDTVADCTLGHGGHAQAFLGRLGPAGRLIGLDVDGAELVRSARRLEAAGYGGQLQVQRSHFAGLPKVLAAQGVEGCDIVFVDLGVSSMQLDDPARGFSYKHDGPLDMRMDDRLPHTAADILIGISQRDLEAALGSLADEPKAARIAAEIAERRLTKPLRTTAELADLVLRAHGLTRRTWKDQQKAGRPKLHPAARTFQALRMLVNDEIGGLEQFLRIVPYCLRRGGRLGIITFHSGEDERVAAHFSRGLAAGVYTDAPPEPIAASRDEIRSNPRSRSARFRWGRRGGACGQGESWR